MIMTAIIIVLIFALAATIGTADAATVMDKPLAYQIFEGGVGCDGASIGSGTITSIVAMGDGTFCENTDQLLDSGDEMTVYTKVVFTSCDATDGGIVNLDSFTCSDSACSDCTDVDDIPVKANLMAPTNPGVDTCWDIEVQSTSVTIGNQFDPSADPAVVDIYWNIYTENSCLKEMSSQSSGSSSAFMGPTALAATMGAMMVTSLLN